MNEEIRMNDAPKYSFSTFDRVMAWLSILLGFFFIRFLPVQNYRLGAVLLLLALFGLTLFHILRSGVRVPARAYCFLAGGAMLIPALLVTSDPTATFFLYLGELAVYMFFISEAGRGDTAVRLDDGFLVDALHSIFVLPFRALDAHTSALFPSNDKKLAAKILRTIGFILLGLCAAIIPTIIITKMLSFDAGFVGLLERIFDIDIAWFMRNFVSLIFGIPIAIYAYSAVISSRLNLDSGDTKYNKQDRRLLPAASVYAAMTPILAVYVIFFISQWDMYLSAFTGVLPEGLIYADYAREGFFQLCIIAGINAVLLLLVNILVRQESKVSRVLLRIYMILTSLFTLILIATAISKLFLYIGAYGLTLKRLNAAWFMVLLAVGFVFVIIKQIWRSFAFVPSVLVAGVILFGVLVYSNAGGIVASYNTNAYFDGRLDGVDVYEVYNMGDAGILSLIRIAEEGGESESYKAKELIERYLNEREKGGFINFNIPRARADAALRNHGYMN